MSTRQQMIFALTKYELEYLRDNPECLEDTAAFFANGGFEKYTDDKLISQCEENVWLELEEEAQA